MHARVMAAGVAVAVLTGSLGGCSSSASSDKSATTAKTLKVGVLNSCSGVLAEAGNANAVECKVLKAWAKTVNDKGGINGRKVDLIVRDDGGNAATSQTMVRELVEKEKVVALLSSPPTPQFAAYLQQKQVPLIASGTTSPEFLKIPMFFNIGTNIVSLVFGVVAEAVKGGNTKLGFLYCAEDPACATAAQLVQGAAQASGATVTAIKVSATAADYTSQCLKLKEAGVTAYQVGSSPQVVLRVADACRKQGLNAKLMSVAGSLNQSYLAAPVAQDIYAITGAAPWFDSSIPAVKEMQEALTAEGMTDFGPGTVDAWAAGKTFEAAAKSLPDKATSADVLAGLYALKGETSGGLTEPLTFTKGQPNLMSSNCYWPITIVAGQYKAKGGADPVCLDAAKLAPVFKALAG